MSTTCRKGSAWKQTTDQHNARVRCPPEDLLVIDQLHCKCSAFFGIRAHDVLQQCNVVWTMVYFLRIEDNLVDLASLCEAGNDLVG